ncbi:MAG: iron chelate uptake ABC transporter family permease subunit [Actinomycetales bacterium]|nr:iron chelate uptake ABC transporter family permease subunit [Actinomycetales bacterium]
MSATTTAGPTTADTAPTVLPGGQRLVSLGAPGRPWFAVVVRARPVVVGLTFLALAALAALVTLTVGELGIPLADLPGVLAGEGSRAQEWALFTSRLPRLGVAVLAGAAFGVAGAIFQSVTRNPLGSPDVIGLGGGAAAGAAAAALVWPGFVPTPVGALIGAFVAIAAVYLGTGRGFGAPHRMVVVGIAIGAMALAFVQLALVRATRESAQEVAVWITGSLAARATEHVQVIALAVLVLLPLALVLTRPMQLAEMGDDLATGVGVPVGLSRTAAVVVAVLLTGAAVSVAGPIAFVALTAPQIARRLTLSSGPGLLAAACCGAFLLVLADLVAQYAMPGTIFPVGVVTAGVGGIYLAFLLVREWKQVAV